MFPSNFIVSDMKSPRSYLVLILNGIVFSSVNTYFYWWIIVKFFVLLNNIFKIILNICYRNVPLGNSNLTFHAGTDISNSLFLYRLFIFFRL